MYYVLIIFIVIIIIINCGKTEVYIKYNRINDTNNNKNDEITKESSVNNKIIDSNIFNNKNELSQQNKKYENFNNIPLSNVYYKDITDKAADYVIGANNY